MKWWGCNRVYHSWMFNWLSQQSPCERILVEMKWWGCKREFHSRMFNCLSSNGERSPPTNSTFSSEQPDPTLNMNCQKLHSSTVQYIHLRRGFGPRMIAGWHADQKHMLWRLNVTLTFHSLIFRTGNFDPRKYRMFESLEH
jgi:hypothetical protein